MHVNQFTEQIQDCSLEIISKLYELVEGDQLHLLALILLELNLELRLKTNDLMKMKKLKTDYSVDFADVVSAHHEILKRLNSLSNRRNH
tara:strand:- start:7628 stop:7894 length:267 start_codon:yes stop_codon:yes gene_type:complete